MGEVAIQLEDELVASRQRPLEAGNVGPAQTVLFGAVQDVNRGMFGRELIGKLPGAIGRIIIHHQHVHGDRQSEKTLRERKKILPLIVSWHNDEGLVHAVKTRGINRPPATGRQARFLRGK